MKNLNNHKKYTSPGRQAFLCMTALTAATVEFGGLSCYTADPVAIVMENYRCRLALAEGVVVDKDLEDSADGPDAYRIVAEKRKQEEIEAWKEVSCLTNINTEDQSNSHLF